MSDLTFRPLQNATEAQACARIMAASEPWVTLGRGFETCLGLVSNERRERYVACQGDSLVGILVLDMKGAFVGYIQIICVAPEFRSQGIGTRLIGFAEQRIFRESPNVFLCVSSFNTPAQRLYERLGYRVVGELKDYLVFGHAEILLRKTLGPLNGHRPAALSDSSVSHPA